MTIVYQDGESIQRIDEILRKEAPKSILIVTGANSYERSGAERLLESHLVAHRVTRLTLIRQLPTIDDLEKAITIIRSERIDLILAIGGGRVLDIAKAASLLHREVGPVDEYIKGASKAQGINISRLLIPTTAGSGAEITPFSVIYLDKTKYSLAHPSMTPEYVILAPELTESLSPKVTAETGCDALAQAIEGYWSVQATDESRDYSRQAMPMILKNLEKSVRSPTRETRRQMLLGAHLAGKSIAIARTTGAHALSYPLTAHYGIPHGHAVMLTLPYFFPINEKAPIGEILKFLEVRSGKEARDKLLGIMDDVGLERQVHRLGVREEDLTKVLFEECNQERLSNNPVPISKVSLQQIIQAIY